MRPVITPRFSLTVLVVFLLSLMLGCAMRPTATPSNTPTAPTASPTVQPTLGFATRTPAVLPLTPTTPTVTPFPTAAWGAVRFSAPERAARLTIPAIGVDAPIVSLPLTSATWDIAALTQEIGWLQSTGAFVGDTYAPALAAHVTLDAHTAGPFLRLNDVANGDAVTLQLNGVTYRYRVVSRVIVAPTDTQELYVPDGNVLLLTTCIHWDKQLRAYRDRLVVRAERVP